MKFGAWLDIWMDNYVVPSAKIKTAICYESIVKNHIKPRLGDYELSDVTALTIQKVATDLLKNGNKRTRSGLSTNTVNLVITIIQNALTTAENVGEVNLREGKIKRPKIKEKSIACFSLYEQKKIEQAVINHKNPKMFGILLSLYTGLRIGELLALEWSDVNLKTSEIYVSKSCSDVKINGKFTRVTNSPKTCSSERVIPIPKQLIPLMILIKKTNRSKYVVGYGDRLISVRSYQRSFEIMQKKLHIEPRGFHSLRHTFATRALESGMDVKALAEILGHKNPTITLNRYAHSFMLHKKTMMNKLGKLL